MKNKSLTPHIRFKGYDDEWQQSSFGEVCTVHDGVHQTPRYTDSGVMFVSVENIKSLQSNKFISIEAFKSDYKTVPERNDILMTRIGDIGTANIVLSDEPMAYYVSLALLKSPSIDSFFFKSSIGCPDTKRELWKRTLHIAFPKKINKNEISHVGIKLPSASEQKDIGDFFRQIDEVLHDTEREITRLEKMKQASLQKMFPRPGETTPEIRFDGFDGEWRRCKLSELLTQRIEHQKISEDEPLLAFSYAEGVIDPEDKKSNKRDFLMTDKFNKIFSRTEVDDIIYNPANVIHGAIHRNTLKTGVVSPIYKIFSCSYNISPKYMGVRLRTPHFIAEILKYIEGTVIKLRTLSPESFLNMEIEIPNSLSEQECIGEYFVSLDAIISAKRKKLDKLQNLKQSCLDKMFVNTAAQ